MEYPTDRLHPYNGRGYAYVDFSNADEAESAMKHMDGGIGQIFFKDWVDTDYKKAAKKELYLINLLTLIKFYREFYTTQHMTAHLNQS